LYRILSTK